MAQDEAPKMQPTLGLTGLTMNAMALIAPGAFLWLTFFIQASAGNYRPADVGWDRPRALTMPGYRRLLRGNGQALPRHRQFVLLRGTVLPQSRESLAICPALEVHRRLGLASLLLDLSRRDGRRHGRPLRISGRHAMAKLHERVPSRARVHGAGRDGHSFFVAWIAYRGVDGSTAVNIAINVIQISALLVFSVMALGYRVNHPPGSVAWNFDATSGEAYSYEFLTEKQTVDGKPVDVIVRTADGTPKPKLDASRPAGALQDRLSGEGRQR